MGTTSEKLTYLNTTKNLIKEELNLGGANITNEPFRAYKGKLEGIYKDFLANGTDTLWNNWLPKVTGTGETITLNNTIEAKMDFVYKGNTSQTGTPTPDTPIPVQVVSGDNTINVCGKNILKYPYLNTTSTVSGVTFTDNGNGSITINGTSTSSTYSLWFLYENAWNYNKLSFELNPGTYTFKGLTTNKVTMACNFYFSDNSNEYFSIAQNDVTKTITNKVRLNMRILVHGGTTVDNVTIYPQIEVGSSSSSFEPYNGNTYPINLPVENLFDDSTTTNILIADGGTEQVNSNIKTSTYIKVEPNTIYTCSSKLLPNKTLGWLKFSYYNASKNYLSYLYTDNTIRTITTSNNCEYIRIGYHTNIVNDVQFEVGSKANSYTPYETTPIELCKIGTYQDKIYKDSGKWYLNKQIGKVVLDGSENWSYNRSPTDRTVIELFNYILLKNTNYYSNCFVKDSSTLNRIVLTTQDSMIYMSLADTITGITSSDTDSQKLSKMKTWLSTHNTTVYYVLATPTITEITDTTLISQLEAIKKSYNSQTSISQVNTDKPFILDVVALGELESI